MNLWIIGIIAVGMLAIAGIVVAGIGTVDADEEVENIECSSCNNACTRDSNCGLESCGAVNGGSCGCGR